MSESSTAPGDGSPPEVPWGVDAVIGAAAVTARTTLGVAEAVASSMPARAAVGALRWISGPVIREGETVRERLATDAGPAATDAVRRVAPGVLGAVDLDAILAAIDIAGLLDRIDVAGVVRRVDVGEIVSRVDLDEIVQRVDVDRIVERVDVDRIIERVDVADIIDRVDLNLLLERIDINRLLERVDLDAILQQVDLNALVARLDIEALVSNTELGGIIAQSTSGVASEALDAVRSQGVGLDNFIARLANRLLRRDPMSLPAGPPLLVDDQLALPAAGGSSGEGAGGGV